MKRAQRRQQGRNAFDVIEESTHLLRTAPVATLTTYYLGAIPFVLGLLFFWADMSRSPLAPQHIASASFGLALLFFWMKFCQSLFARRVRAQASHEAFPALRLRQGLRIFFKQGIIQSTALFLLPLASVPVLPFAWVYAFYQSAGALDTGEDEGTAALMKKSWRPAKLWAAQNNAVLALLFLFAFCVFLNWITVCAALPELGKMLFGIESDFTKSSSALFNTTFFAAMLGLTYLCVDPIVKTIYALRCFYGESLESGEDLKAELTPFIHSTIKSVAAILIFAAILSASRSSAETTPAPAPASGQTVEAPDLDQAINDTIHERKYIWRMPRERVIEQEKPQGVIGNFFTKAGDMIRNWVEDVGKWLAKLRRKLFQRHPRPTDLSSNHGTGWITSLQVLLYVLAAAVIIALAIFIIRLVRNRAPPIATTAGEAIAPVPDLTDENVRADQLPEDGWTKLARELLERGEFRLAMRAFYLAGLAHLATRNLISIARFKSNREYERELRRRAHAIPNLPTLFGDTISNFERVWYGTHEATVDLAQQFAAGVDKLKASG
jgi:hypothetical protein